MKQHLLIAIAILISMTVSAEEHHVSKNGPLSTIQAAANLAQPGDIIIVHEGVYRERITPPRGGESDQQRITYRAAAGEKVEIKGSEVIQDWKKVEKDVWKTTIPNSFFGDYNPYIDVINGDWFSDHGRLHHTGEVYLNGKSLWEMESLDKVLNPVVKEKAFDPEGSIYTWYCESDEENTYIYANFQGANPKKELVEINVRSTCFYPAQTGISYITIDGFRFSQAATQWAAPTAEQIGLIGTFWSKGWVIENNVISDSKCSGITLGKDRATGHNAWNNEKTKGGACIYNEVILRALKIGWSKENIGSHMVRNNTIFNCEQTGMCGSLGAAFSTVKGNHIYNIWRKRQFSGAEIGGIKFHAPIDAIISDNCLHDAFRGLWMDWMTQGTRISSNVCYNNDFADLFIEVNHGPSLIDNNIFLSGIQNWSQGAAYVHNIIAGRILLRQVLDRFTPYHFPHTTELMGLNSISCGDDRWYNNIFIAPEVDITNMKNLPHAFYGLKAYNTMERSHPIFAGGNLFYKGAIASEGESNSMEVDSYSPDFNISEEADGIYLTMTFDKNIRQIRTGTITSETLGSPLMVHHRYEFRDGSDILIDSDFLGQPRDLDKPAVGPIEEAGEGKIKIKVWNLK